MEDDRIKEDDIIREENNPEENNPENNNPGEENREEHNPEEQKAGISTPPPVANRFGLEEEWAEKLGMDFDPSRVSPPPMPAPTPESPAQTGGPYVVDATRQMQGGPQPMAYGPQPMPEREPMPPTYMLWAVLATICCCMPAGIVAIIFSSSVSSKYFSRDYEGARRASRNAEIWIIASIVLGVIANALYLPLVLLTPQ